MSTSPDKKTYLCVFEAAVFLNLSPHTLNVWRSKGRGPVFRKFGGKVVYALDDLRAFADAGQFENTAQSKAYERGGLK